MRKLARIVKLDNVEKHANADTLDVCSVGGWTVVSKHGLHKAGDYVVYCEIDSWMPHSLAPFLTKEGKEPRVFEDTPGQVLKTVRLRGIVSQGLIIPVRDTLLDDTAVFEGNDVSELLGILKYEPPLPAALAGNARCSFPSVVPKTDSERIQNLSEELEKWKQEQTQFCITEKLDGTSVTYIKDDGDIHVCSRNWSLQDTDNTYWQVFRKYGIEKALAKIPFNCAIQGEIIGPGIQDNIYKLNAPTLFVFNIYNIDMKAYIAFSDMLELCIACKLTTVPFIGNTFIDANKTIDELLNFADGKSLINTSANREGLVYKGIENTSLNFKTISNEWLLKKN
jgi:RNA ligase (TIGR02306 family)